MKTRLSSPMGIDWATRATGKELQRELAAWAVNLKTDWFVTLTTNREMNEPALKKHLREWLARVDRFFLPPMRC